MPKIVSISKQNKPIIKQKEICLSCVFPTLENKNARLQYNRNIYKQ